MGSCGLWLVLTKDVQTRVGLFPGKDTGVGGHRHQVGGWMHGYPDFLQQKTFRQGI